MTKAHKYARDVIQGKVVASKWVRLACERHVSDLDRGFRYRFDAEKAEKACRFMESFPHTKGKWAARREPFVLEPWQCFAVCSVFGWVEKTTGLRRFTEFLLFVPRKNGKSDLSARIGLDMFAEDGEYGAEVYSGATSEKQAWEVFRPARLMALRTDDFREWYGAEVNASNIHILENGSRFEPVIGKPGDGTSPSCAIIDEYHEHATDDMAETMQTGMGAREQPLLLITTTAGDNLSGPCFSYQKDAEKVLEGVYENDRLFALIYCADKDDDWTDVEVLKKANPNYGVSISEEFLLSRRTEAMRNSRKQSAYKTKHLNLWVGSRNAYFNVKQWQDCGDSTLKLEDFEGERCYLGIDLASKVDIADLEIVFPISETEFVVFGRHYLPESTATAGENEHYQGWMRDGWLTVTDGDIIDYSEIESDILDLSSRFQVEELAYDPHQATMLVTRLMDEGVPVVEMRPTVLNFSEPMKHLDAKIKAKQMKHNGDPVMTWMMSNVVAKEDRKDNVYPNKERPENKIDGPVALIMALGRAMNADDTTNVYDFRGVVSV